HALNAHTPPKNNFLLIFLYKLSFMTNLFLLLFFLYLKMGGGGGVVAPPPPLCRGGTDYFHKKHNFILGVLLAARCVFLQDA
ncbi:hypothetical protein O6377_24110, partial [Salmonella enterica subsp. enterica]